MPTTRANGIEIYYEVHGEGLPLLLIMGLGANATAWWKQIPEFSRRYRVIAFDNRGAGRSQKPHEPYSISQMADDAAALMDTLGVGTSHVFGMSLGGMIAQEYALRYPERVQALVLGGTTPGGPKAVRAGAEVLAFFATVGTLTPPAAIERGMSLLYSDAFIEANRTTLLARALELAPLMAPPHGLQRQLMAAMMFSAYDRLGKIAAPSLVMSATADKIVPHANSALLTEGIVGSRLVEFEGAGHGFLVECHEAANAAVLDFLQPYDGTRASK
jgi:pimeloyl-ACP methyl ester carboxylesterase